MLFNYLHNEEDAESENTLIESANEKTWETWDGEGSTEEWPRQGVGEMGWAKALQRVRGLSLLMRTTYFSYFSSTIEALSPWKGALSWPGTSVKVGK